MVAALAKAQREPKAPLDAMSADVYAELPWHLTEQRAEVGAHVARHPGACPGVPVHEGSSGFDAAWPSSAAGLAPGAPPGPCPNLPVQ